MKRNDFLSRVYGEAVAVVEQFAGRGRMLASPVVTTLDDFLRSRLPAQMAYPYWGDGTIPEDWALEMLDRMQREGRLFWYGNLFAADEVEVLVHDPGVLSDV